VERTPETLGGDFHAGFWRAIGIRRNLVRRGGLAVWAMEAGGEGVVAQELRVLQPTAASGVYAGGFADSVV